MCFPGSILSCCWCPTTLTPTSLTTLMGWLSCGTSSSRRTHQTTSSIARYDILCPCVTSLCVSPCVSVSPCISLHVLHLLVFLFLPVSPRISLCLPVSPCVSLCLLVSVPSLESYHIDSFQQVPPQLRHRRHLLRTDHFVGYEKWQAYSHPTFSSLKLRPHSSHLLSGCSGLPKCSQPNFHLH